LEQAKGGIEERKNDFRGDVGATFTTNESLASFLSKFSCLKKKGSGQKKEVRVQTDQRRSIETRYRRQYTKFDQEKEPKSAMSREKKNRGGGAVRAGGSVTQKKFPPHQKFLPRYIKTLHWKKLKRRSYSSILMGKKKGKSKLKKRTRNDFEEEKDCS